MKNTRYIIILMIFSLVSCDYGDLNDNPNAPTEVPEILLLTGPMLANTSINASHLQRISGMWSGQYKGETLLYGSLYNYVIASEESNSAWEYLYNGIMAQNDIIQSAFPSDNLIQGITKVVEANAAGTAAANWGDIPYSQAVNIEFDDPIFDGQRNVFDQLQSLLDEAITNLSMTDGYALTQDIYFGGDAGKWLAVAYSLKARYYTLTKQYGLAYTAAQQGIASGAGSMTFKPTVGDDGSGISGASNILWSFTSGARAGYMSTEGTYLSQLLDASSTVARNNAKTNEDARSKYYYINPDGSDEGIGAPGAPQHMISYEENLLTLAETALRTTTTTEALQYLNTLRTYLSSGDAFLRVNDGDVLLYEAYELTDFEPGGMENVDGISTERALLREIIEERYVSTYGTFTPWNDARRLRHSDNDVSVPFPLNTTEVNKYPERFIISQNEINSNENAPQNISIYDKTEVNL